MHEPGKRLFVNCRLVLAHALVALACSIWKVCLSKGKESEGGEDGNRLAVAPAVP